MISAKKVIPKNTPFLQIAKQTENDIKAMRHVCFGCIYMIAENEVKKNGGGVLIRRAAAQWVRRALLYHIPYQKINRYFAQFYPIPGLPILCTCTIADHSNR